MLPMYLGVFQLQGLHCSSSLFSLLACGAQLLLCRAELRFNSFQNSIKVWMGKQAGQDTMCTFFEWGRDQG